MHSNIRRLRRAPALRIKNTLAPRVLARIMAELENGSAALWIPSGCAEVTILRPPIADRLAITARMRRRHGHARR